MNPLELITAVDNTGAIGVKDRLPWGRHAEDMKHFRATTMGATLIMGRKTFESIPAPLAGRRVIVMSATLTDPGWADGIARSVEEVRDEWNAHPDRRFIVAGGAEIYEQFFDHVSVIHWTRIKGVYEADTYFPGPRNEAGFLWRFWNLESQRRTESAVFSVFTKER